MLPQMRAVFPHFCGPREVSDHLLKHVWKKFSVFRLDFFAFVIPITEYLSAMCSPSLRRARRGLQAPAAHHEAAHAVVALAVGVPVRWAH